MRRVCPGATLWLALLMFVPASQGAELRFAFNDTREHTLPQGFRSVIAGYGQPGEWEVVLEPVSPAGLLSSTNTTPVFRAVLTQKSRSLIDSHFPILLYDEDTFADFTFTTRVQIKEGDVDQMAGIVFRLVDEKNFYVYRISVKDGTLRFYKVVNGQIQRLFGPSRPFKLNQWYELSVKCEGNQFHFYLDGAEAIPMITDAGFSKGKIGFWTKSDTVASFSGARVVYTPHLPPAQALVADVLTEYPRVVGLKIAMAASTNANAEPCYVASKLESDIGKPADKSSLESIKSGTVFYGKEKGVVHVTMPVRDRNGDPIAAVRVTLDSLFGQTERNALARARPIVKMIQSRVLSRSDLIE